MYLWDSRIWREAEWFATGYSADPVALALVFRDIEAGARIFEIWRKALGADDEDEALRISIIEGRAPGHPPGYTITVGIDPSFLISKGLGGTSSPEIALSWVHTNRMNTTPESRHLPSFKEAFQREGSFLLLPASPDGGSFLDLGIRKRCITFRRVEDLQPGELDLKLLGASLLP